MSRETEFALMPAIIRLEQQDVWMSGIDLRGKGKRRRQSDEEHRDAPSHLIEKFSLALKYYDRPQLKTLALHNHFLDPKELPLLFDALPFIPSLDSLVIFHHDLGDDGVELLLQTLMCKTDSPTSKVKKDNVDDETLSTTSSFGQQTTPLKELFLSHCNISCTGAASIANALQQSSDAQSCTNKNNKLKCLQVLSLGSNKIKREGAFCLAKAFGHYPALNRLVLHGNKDILDEMNDESRKHIFYQAITPIGWQRKINERNCTTTTITTPTTIAMAVLSPLILPHIQRRWEKDRVLIRPYDELRRQLKHQMYKTNSTFVDSESNLKLMPDILAWMARLDMCQKQTSMSSPSEALNPRVKKTHTEGCEICPSCACTGMSDVYELLHRMPHLLCLLRGIV